MTPTSRRNVVFIAVLLLGAAGAAAMFFMRPGDAPGPAVSQSAPQAEATKVAGAAPAALPQADCSFAPIVASAGGDDGQVTLKESAADQSSSAVSALLVKGKEAAAAGNRRDAEAQFLMACRTAEGLAKDPVPLADAMYQLGRHYAQLAAAPDAAKRPELLRRAEALYATSLQSYLTHRGESHEKTRFAQEGLAAVQKLAGTTGKAPVVVAKKEEKKAPEPAKPVVVTAPPVVAQAPAPAPAAAPKVAVAPPPVAVAPPPPVVAAAPAPKPAAKPVAPAAPPEPKVAAVEPKPEPTVQARRTRPSFDCAKARSASERRICDDEELAQADRDLGRIYQRAKEASPDPRAFQRDSDAQWRRREDGCQGDRECLRRWYAERRAQLTAAANAPAAEPAARPAPPRQPAPAQRARVAEPSDRPVELTAPPADAVGDPNADAPR